MCIFRWGELKMCLLWYNFGTEETTPSQTNSFIMLLMCATRHQSLSNTLLCLDTAFPSLASRHIHPRNRFDNYLMGVKGYILRLGRSYYKELRFGEINEIWSVTFTEWSMTVLHFPLYGKDDILIHTFIFHWLKLVCRTKIESLSHYNTLENAQ